MLHRVNIQLTPVNTAFIIRHQNPWCKHVFTGEVMKSIAFHLQKGGVGKTTLSVSIACALSTNHKTVLIDADPQGNSSAWLADGLKVEYELADVLYGRIKVQDAIVNAGSLSLLPTFGVDGELKLFGENQLSREPFVFADLVDELSGDGYEVAIFDLSPGMSQLERSVLLAVNEIVVPMMPDVFSLDGLETFASEVQKIEKGFRRPVKYSRVVVNGLNRSIGQHLEIHEAATKTTFETFTVGQDPVFRKAQALHIPAQLVDGRDRMKQETLEEIDRLASALMRRRSRHAFTEG